MKKVLIRSAGGYEKLEIVESPTPSVSKGQVHIKVQFSGVNYADCLVRWGVYESAKKYIGWPITPGFEVCGKVIAIGEGVTEFGLGDTVMGFTRFGGYASEICINKEYLLKLPSNFSPAEGAAFPAVFMTAYYSLLQIVFFPKGAKILIHSAAGGVGTALVQICLALGYTPVSIVGRPHKIQYLKDLGCKYIYDKSDPTFRWEQIHKAFPDKFDGVFDANGYTTIKESYELLRPTGKLMIYGAHSLLPKTGGKINYLKAALGILKSPRFDPMKLVTDNKSLVCFNVSFLFSEQSLIKENLDNLQKMASQGAITPPKVTIFNINDVAKAHQLIESGESTGKIVLEHNH